MALQKGVSFGILSRMRAFLKPVCILLLCLLLIALLGCAEKAAEAYDGGKKKARKQKKSNKNTPVVIEKQDRLRIAMDPKRKYNPYEDVEVGEEDYSSSADMFKGISFNS